MIQSVERALKILEIVSQKKEGESLTRIAKAMQLEVPTTHNLIRTLAEKGYVEQNRETLRYHLGIKSYLLGLQYEKFNIFVSIIEPYLLKLSEKFNEHVVLSILKDCQLILIRDVESSQHLITNPRYMSGTLHCTGTGKLLLAYLSKEEVNRCIRKQGLKKFTSKTISTREKLYEELKKIRNRGYSIMKEEMSERSCAVGVPIYNERGKVIASVGMSLPAFRFKGKRRKEIIQFLCETGKEISDLMRLKEK